MIKVLVFSDGSFQLPEDGKVVLVTDEFDDLEEVIVEEDYEDLCPIEDVIVPFD